MNNNSFEVVASENDIKEFLKSSIKSSEMVIEHYDFVINDISSTISDVQLEATKGPIIEFLNKMRNHWIDFKSDCEMKLRNLGK